MSTRRFLGTVVLAAIGPALFAGDDAPKGPPMGGPPGKGEIFKMVDAYLLANVQEALGLSDEQNAKVLPQILKLQADRRGFFRRRGKALGEMKKLLGSGAATEAQVAEQMKEYRALESDELDTLRKDVESIDKELTVVQQAKFRILEREVVRKIEGLIEEHRRKIRIERPRDRMDRPGADREKPDRPSEPAESTSQK